MKKTMLKDRDEELMKFLMLSPDDEEEEEDNCDECGEFVDECTCDEDPEDEE